MPLYEFWSIDPARQLKKYTSGSICINKSFYHLGITHGVKKSTLSDANENRDWRIYADYAQILIKQCRQLMSTFNSTEIDLAHSP